jgi:hypothetical protein
VVATRPLGRHTTQGTARLQRALRALAAWRRRAASAHLSASNAQVAGLLGGLLTALPVAAVDVPEDRAESMIHVYDGGGVRADGPALLVRKRMTDNLSISGSYYVDAVTNASIDVVTTASPYQETRKAYTFGADYVHRDMLMSLSTEVSDEPDYKATTVSADLSQETFGGMTTLSMGFSRGKDDVGKKGIGFFDTATHWKYRLGVTQILSPRWLAAVNYESVSDSGFLGSPYRAARVFGAAVPERNPRTRTSQALNFRVIGEVVPGTSVRAGYRYFWDTWNIKAHTVEVGTSRYFGQAWLADATLRLTSQSDAIFYSNDATSETQYISRNRQLSSYTTAGLGGKLSYQVGRVAGRFDVKAGGAYELVRFSFKDFTDLRTGGKYTYNANVLQLFLNATF